jgi:hypothetical protein
MAGSSAPASDSRRAAWIVADFFPQSRRSLTDALAYRPARRVRRRVRRRIRVRRRFRRRAIRRIVFGRPFWVVPVALVVGWELALADRVVVVKETRIIEKEGNKVEVAVVQDSDGKTEQIEITREDTADNAGDLEGSVIADSDKTTPGVDSETEVEVDE